MLEMQLQSLTMMTQRQKPTASLAMRSCCSCSRPTEDTLSYCPPHRNQSSSFRRHAFVLCGASLIRTLRQARIPDDRLEPRHRRSPRAPQPNRRPSLPSSLGPSRLHPQAPTQPHAPPSRQQRVLERLALPQSPRAQAQDQAPARPLRHHRPHHPRRHRQPMRLLNTPTSRALG